MAKYIRNLGDGLITISKHALPILLSYGKIKEDKFSAQVEGVGEFSGWYIEADTGTGTFDFEKSASYDYQITLIAPNGDEYIAVGGWYNMNGHSFNEDLDFFKVQTYKPFGYTKELEIECDDDRFMSSSVKLSWSEKDQDPDETLRICRLQVLPQSGGNTVILRLEEVEELISKLEVVKERLS